ncbi:MAG: hypothetical protein ACMG6E_06675 [Candidatus Roizmanbacteria bacterium]
MGMYAFSKKEGLGLYIWPDFNRYMGGWKDN